jgi:mono/diheme cytochrome c family protein
MRRLLLGAACLALLGGSAMRLLAPRDARADADVQPIAASGARVAGDLVARGAYLAHAADCEACHNGAAGAFAGGRAFKTPFGTIYASNITPDPQTGVGGYTDDEWVSALRRGVGRGGKHLYPAMPYTNYTLMTREDALAIKAYVMAQPSVKANTPDNDMSFPFNIRFLMVFWNALYNPDHTFVQDASHDAVWNRGAYLAEALGHCQQCHTPRNILQGLKSGQAYAGAMQQGWLASNVTSAASGIGDWKSADLATYLSTGRADGHGVAAGPMAEAVSYSTRFLTQDDSTALATYIKTMPAHETKMTPPATQIAEDALGSRIFEGACASCHRANGTGVESSYAALLGDSAVSDPDGINVMQMLREGGAIATPQGWQAMPSFAQGYSDAELAAVANYTIGAIGHVQGTVGGKSKVGS